MNMTKAIYIIFIIVLAGVITAASICAPTLLAKNEFLGGFVDHEILGIMAVIMTISIASIATIHIWFNELEQKHGKRVFGKSRHEINQAAFIMIWLFVGQLGLLVVRSNFLGSDRAISFFNGGSILLLLASVVTLLDVMGTVKALTPSDDE
jgi:hypothetical protein